MNGTTMDLTKEKSTVTLTFCECAENNVGMEKLGQIARDGFTVDELEELAEKLNETLVCELVNLNELLVNTDWSPKEEASILIIRNGVDYLLGDGEADDLMQEMFVLEWDKKAWMKGRVVNKKARWNLCFGDEAQEADYAAGKGTIVAYTDIPICNKLRSKLVKLLKFTGKVNRETMKCEGNCYYDWRNCYIMPHGDAERKQVIGVRLGHKFPLFYQWYLKGEPIGRKIKLTLNHGDIYIMSEKAVGTDWLKINSLTLRHSAGKTATIEKNTKKPKKK